jgi:alpha-glucosidase (family GH31 glycosyl hydrolase)
MLSIVTLFLLVCAVQAILMDYHHFSDFDRESNLKALLAGAKPSPRYWPVLLLDVCSQALFGLLILEILPITSSTDPLMRLLSALPFLILVFLLGTLWNHFLNAILIRLPDARNLARQLIGLLLGGIVIVAAILFAISIAIVPNFPFAWQLWLTGLPQILPLASLLFLGLFLLRQLAFFFRAIPVGGTYLHAAFSTFLLTFFIENCGQVIGKPLGLTAWPGLIGIQNIVLGTGIVGMLALFLASMLPGPKKQDDGLESLPLVTAQSEKIEPEMMVDDNLCKMSYGDLRVEMIHSPFGVRVLNSRDEIICQLADKGLSMDRVLYSYQSYPVLFTGNLLKSKWTINSRPINRPTYIRAEGNALIAELWDLKLRITFFASDIVRIEVAPGKTTTSAGESKALSIAFDAPSDAHYLGFGQRFTRIDQHGQEIPFLQEEGGVGYGMLRSILQPIFGKRGSFPSGEQATSFPVPFFLTSRENGPTCGIFWNSYLPAWVSAGKKGRTRLTVLENKLDLFVCTGPDAPAAIRQYTHLTGLPTPPPPWVFLPWKSRTGSITEEDVREDIHKFRELDIPLAHVGVEHWQEIRGSYEFSPRWYPKVDELVKEANQNGYRITAWQFPYMNEGSQTYREGVRNGFFLLNSLGLPYQQRIFQGAATVVDYTNPLASAWHEKLMAENLFGRGFQGTMTDYGESIPPDAIFANGMSGLEMRNAYPVLYVQAVQRAAQSILGEDHLNYPRAGFAASQRFINAQWQGDQDTAWDEGDGLPAAVRAMLNISMCGFPVIGSDIGGWHDWLTPFTTKELFLRWAEVGAYSPLMRAHGGPRGGNREPWRFDEETVEIYRRLSEEHVCLFPYLYSLAEDSKHTGFPLMRHPSLIWPNVPELYRVEDAWMLGEALYVAPVVNQGVTTRMIFLPPGGWWSLSENKPVEGGTEIRVDAPLGKTPLFLRRGFLLPRFAHAFDTFDETKNGRRGSFGDELEVWTYPGEETIQFELFDRSILTFKDGQGSLSGEPRKVEWKIFK